MKIVILLSTALRCDLISLVINYVNKIPMGKLDCWISTSCSMELYSNLLGERGVRHPSLSSIRISVLSCHFSLSKFVGLKYINIQNHFKTRKRKYYILVPSIN